MGVTNRHCQSSVTTDAQVPVKSIGADCLAVCCGAGGGGAPCACCAATETPAAQTADGQSPEELAHHQSTTSPGLLPQLQPSEGRSMYIMSSR